MAKTKGTNKKSNSTVKNSNGANLGYEAQLWKMADALRGNMDAAEYKHVVLGLIFLKYISDAFETKHAELEAQKAQGADPDDPDEYRAASIFWVPKEARWSHLKASAPQPAIGTLVDEAMTAIERDNPSLKGVLPKDYARPGLDKQRLGQLIDSISNICVDDADARSKDVLGRVYECLLSQFPSAEGKKGGETARCDPPESLIDGSMVIPLLTIEAQIKRGLRHHLASLGFKKNEHGFLQPPEVSKDRFRLLHLAQRSERLQKELPFVTTKWPKLKSYFADGSDINPIAISPRVELINAHTWQSDLFRLASLTWSVPVSQGYGRRMRFLVWDDSNGKLIGLAALGDPVFNLRARDRWIGWTVEQREERLVNLLDAYVLGAVPPYNMILGGKLVACLLRTIEVRQMFVKRYSQAEGIISKKRKNAELCLITTTSALGRSSIYNRIRLNGHNIFSSIGYTSGWGHFHIPDDLFAKMRAYLEAANDNYANNHRFGNGPNWKLRAVRKVLSMIGIDTDLMRHGIAREVFVCSLASNVKEYLIGRAEAPDFTDLKGAEEVAVQALTRWIVPRAERRPEFRAWRRDDVEQMFKPSKATIHQNEPTMETVSSL